MSRYSLASQKHAPIVEESINIYTKSVSTYITASVRPTILYGRVSGSSCRLICNEKRMRWKRAFADALVYIMESYCMWRDRLQFTIDNMKIRFHSLNFRRFVELITTERNRYNIWRIFQLYYLKIKSLVSRRCNIFFIISNI